MKLVPQPLKDGFLVIFEGIDGSGKSTQLKLAQEELVKEGWSSLYASRNLGGTPIGEELRKVMKAPIERPNTTDLYISVAIQEALTDRIQAERAKGQLILMDRGPLSLATYAIYGGGLNAMLGWQHVDTGMAQLQPELIILYKMAVPVALERVRQKSGQPDYFESKPASYFDKVAHGYDDAAKRYPQTVIIDGSQSVEAVHAQSMRAIREALSKKLAV